jgi:hypothetical protein
VNSLFFIQGEFTEYKYCLHQKQQSTLLGTKMNYQERYLQGRLQHKHKQLDGNSGRGVKNNNQPAEEGMKRRLTSATRTDHDRHTSNAKDDPNNSMEMTYRTDGLI